MIVTTLRAVHFIALISIVSCRTVKNMHSRSESVFNSETNKNHQPDVLKTVLQSRLVDTRSFDSDEPESNESQVTKAPSYRLDLGSSNTLDKDADTSNQVVTAEDSSQDTTPDTQDDGVVENTTLQAQDDSSESNETKEDEEEQQQNNQEESQETLNDHQSSENQNEHHEENHNASKTDLISNANNAEDTTYKKECVEGDVIRVDCNTCVCSSGNYFCSKKVCDSKYGMRTESKKNKDPEPMVIEVNHTASFDQDVSSIFNVIRISTTTTSTTTTPSTTPIPDCVDGRTKPVDCNQCICAMGKWACTKQACIALTLREKASFTGSDFIERVATLKENSNMDDDCFEGETKPVGCNQCVCHQNSWACTDMKCPSTTVSTIPNEIEETCQTEEDVKSKECNICACRRGLWVCTKNDCKKFGNKYYHPSIRTSTTPTDLLDTK